MRAIDADALYERACELEAQALAYVGKIINDETKVEEWKIWSAILAERTAFKHDVFDAPTIEPEPHWIKCSERLPERGKDVLVTRDYDGREDFNKSCRYVEVASSYGEENAITWNSYSDEYKMTPKNHHVIAWMPLPEPYREESDELGEEPEVWLDTDVEIAQRAQWRTDKAAIEAVPTAGCEYWDTESNYCALYRPAAVPTADLSEYCDQLWKTAYERGKAEAYSKKGKWIDGNKGKWNAVYCPKCSVCGTPFYGIETARYHYCPNCGARMEANDDHE